MSRIRFLFIIAIIIVCGSIVNAQSMDKIGFYSQSGGDAFCQFSAGGAFGCVLHGASGSLTITSEYTDTTNHESGNEISEQIAIGEGISVYPNPAEYIVNVIVSDAVDAAENSTLEIYNLDGVLVFMRAIDNYGGEFPVDLSALANGTYIMRVGKASAKIVKQ